MPARSRRARRAPHPHCRCCWRRLLPRGRAALAVQPPRLLTARALRALGRLNRLGGLPPRRSSGCLPRPGERAPAAVAPPAPCAPGAATQPSPRAVAAPWRRARPRACALKTTEPAPLPGVAPRGCSAPHEPQQSRPCAAGAAPHMHEAPAQHDRVHPTPLMCVHVPVACCCAAYSTTHPPTGARVRAPTHCRAHLQLAAGAACGGSTCAQRTGGRHLIPWHTCMLRSCCCVVSVAQCRLGRGGGVPGGKGSIAACLSRLRADLQSAGHPATPAYELCALGVLQHCFVGMRSKCTGRRGGQAPVWGAGTARRARRRGPVRPVAAAPCPVWRSIPGTPPQT